ncbi:MAG: hypothetical protein Ct9H300mP10_04500 [Methanobacteriota archaeon]|nr:MAG: hypothetical protein Ct9H300mP10_04500 [Euryarchaeota archaeon]
MVDTGIDDSHPDFANLTLTGFRDFYEDEHDLVRDVGEDSHGTMMAGLLVADGKFRGAAPGVDLSVALALGPSGTSGQEDRVAQAIRWCRITQKADIVSLSLAVSRRRHGDSVRDHTSRAGGLGRGHFCGRRGRQHRGDPDIFDVSVPANLPGVIAVGSSTRSGSVWSNSAGGSLTNPYGDGNRSYPDQKPEVTAPGVLLFSTTTTLIEPPYAIPPGPATRQSWSPAHSR